MRRKDVLRRQKKTFGFVVQTVQFLVEFLRDLALELDRITATAHCTQILLRIQSVLYALSDGTSKFICSQVSNFSQTGASWVWFGVNSNFNSLLYFVPNLLPHDTSAYPDIMISEALNCFCRSGGVF